MAYRWVQVSEPRRSERASITPKRYHPEQNLLLCHVESDRSKTYPSCCRSRRRSGSVSLLPVSLFMIWSNCKRLHVRHNHNKIIRDSYVDRPVGNKRSRSKFQRLHAGFSLAPAHYQAYIITSITDQQCSDLQLCPSAAISLSFIACHACPVISWQPSLCELSYIKTNRSYCWALAIVHWHRTTTVLLLLSSLR